MKILSIRFGVVSGGALFLVSGCTVGATDPVEDDAVVTSRAALSDISHRAGIAELGELIFNDTRLSASGTQACASCHVEEVAFTGNNKPDDPLFPVAIGAFPSLIGTRNSPTAKYRAASPGFGFVLDEGEYAPVGGNFWDGRADTLADQAKQPFLNPREMALSSKADVVALVKHGPYADLFRRVFGRHAFDDVDAAYDDIANAIQAFELTPLFAPYSSKFDWVLLGKARFTPKERRGFALFKDPDKGNCIACHVGDENSRDPKDWQFTDFTYDNLGVPRNMLIPDNADPDHFDLGVCAQAGIVDKVPPEVGDVEQFLAGLCGAFKVPTLRNAAITPPYMHNGKFNTLREVVSFYVTRDTNPERWYPVRPDGSIAKFDDLPTLYQGNVNTSEVPYDRHPGEKPHLNSEEIEDLVAFLETLTDGYSPEHSAGHR